MNDGNGLIDRLTAVDTSTLSNAIEKLCVRSRISGFANRDMRCLAPELGVMCGYAVTAEVETMSPDCEGGLDEGFIELCRAVLESAHPAVVVLREATGHPEYSTHCGEVMATIFRRLGCLGLVSDSAVRDLLEIKALGFHCFAPGLVASHGSFRVVRVQVPVTVCGLKVEPGDLLHGDLNGLIKVPAEGRHQLPDLVEKVRRDEARVLDYVHSDDFTIDGLSELLTH